MTSEHSSSNLQGATARELVMAAVLLLVITFVQLGASGTARLIFHPPWLDECLTEVVANDPSFVHSMKAIADGVNHTPPTYFLLIRPLCWISGKVGIVQLRLLSAFAGLLAGLAIFALARMFCDRVCAFLAAAALWAHPVFVELLYEARFYLPWLAAIAWLCVFMVRDERHRSQRDLALASLMAILVATLHWYGALVLALVGGIDLLRHRSLRRIIPFACGAIALACCLPVLKAQLSLLAVPSWIEPVNLIQLRTVAVELFCVIPPILAAIAWWISPLAARDEARDVARDEAREDLNVPRASVGALLLLPVALLALSLAGQPAMISRYAVAVAIPLCLITAWLASMISGKRAGALRIGLLIVIVIWGGIELRARAAYLDPADTVALQSVDAVNDVIARNQPLPVIFLRRNEMYPAIYLQPALAPAVALLNFDRGEEAHFDVAKRFEQQMTSIDHAEYPRYQMVNSSELWKASHFFIIVPPPAASFLPMIFPDAQIRQHSDVLFEITTR